MENNKTSKMKNFLFYGTYTYSLDRKSGRISIPSKWRKKLDIDCVYLYDNKFYSSVYYIKKDYRKISLENIIKNTERYYIDNKGRIVLTKEKHKSTEKAEIKGYGMYFTICDFC